MVFRPPKSSKPFVLPPDADTRPATTGQRVTLYKFEKKDNRDETLTMKQAHERIQAALARKELSEKEVPRGVNTHDRFRELWDRAKQVGFKAGTDLVPVGMRVIQRENPMDDSSPVKKYWDEPDGVCGFAWLKFKGNSPFARWAKKQPDIRIGDGYPTGKTISISDHNQSMQRKEAHAEAACKVLQEGGVEVWVEARLD